MPFADYIGQPIQLFGGTVEDVRLDSSGQAVADIRMPDGTTKVESVDHCHIEAIKERIWKLRSS
jgi:hypothetical protein